MHFEPISREFFHQNTLQLAENLIGKIIVHETTEGTIAAKIIETEAYLGAEDRAAHSFGNRRTKRTEVMFGEPGSVYTYKMHTHTLLNVVSAPEETPHAILLRAGEPIAGHELIAQNRPHVAEKDWMNGPGKLAKALNVSMDYYGHHWSERPLFIAHGENEHPIVAGPRVGIQNTGEAVHYPYRFYLEAHPLVSKYR